MPTQQCELKGGAEDRYRLTSSVSSQGGRVISFTQAQLDQAFDSGTGIAICKPTWGSSAQRIIRPAYNIRCTGNSAIAQPSALVAGFRPQLMVRWGAGGQSRIRIFEGLRPFCLECSELDIAFLGLQGGNVVRSLPNTDYAAENIRGSIEVQIGNGNLNEGAGSNLRSSTFYCEGGAFAHWCCDSSEFSGGSSGWGTLNAARADSFTESRPCSLISLAGTYNGADDVFLQLFDRAPVLDQYGIYVPDGLSVSGLQNNTVAWQSIRLKAGENFSIDFGPEGMPFYVGCVFALSTTPVTWSPIAAEDTPDISMRAVWWENSSPRLNEGAP